ncbi:hypothetical protein [Streptomyces sulphureus]|nr:hypothetical protein [Streptomyces sulphureus]
MSDDGSDGGSGSPRRHSAGSLRWGTLRRAMRWETFALLLALVVLAALFS